jgi:hypothetical protein
VQSSQYDAANQVIGFGYDAAGNRTDDTTGVLASYDALSRMTARAGQRMPTTATARWSPRRPAGSPRGTPRILLRA